MTRTHRGLLIVPTLALAACGGRGTGEEAASGATPTADTPADATPWQVRDTAPGDGASVRR